MDVIHAAVITVQPVVAVAVVQLVVTKDKISDLDYSLVFYVVFKRVLSIYSPDD